MTTTKMDWTLEPTSAGVDFALFITTTRMDWTFLPAAAGVDLDSS